VKHRALTVTTAVLVPLVLFAALVVSGARGGAGVRFGQSLIEIHKVDEGHFDPSSGDPVFVLVMGNDARGDEVGSNGDALHLVGVNPSNGQATILNIPRDTYIPLPGGLGTNKINAAHAAGGPVLQARAVGQLVGVNVQYVIDTGFVGFQAMVDELGGVDVNVPFKMADSDSGAYFDPGVTHMDGGNALAFSRDRHFDGGDFVRSADQSLVILAGLAKLRAEGASAANTLRWLGVLLRHATFDGGSLSDLYHLGRLALSIDPANVRAVTMPGTAGMAGAASVVFVGADAPSLFADFRDDAILESH
jgi:LCP family protein required for cell wall assembly